MKFAYWTFAVIIIAAAMLFALSNRGSIDIRFWPVVDFAMPTYVAVFSAFVAGFLSGVFLLWLRAFIAIAKKVAWPRAKLLQRQFDAKEPQTGSLETTGVARKSVIPGATLAEPSHKPSGTV